MVGVLYSVEEGPKRGGRGTLLGYPISVAIWLVPWTPKIRSIFQSLHFIEGVKFV